MSYTLPVEERLYSDGDLIRSIKEKNYRVVLNFFNTNYIFYFVTDQSGAVFETCVDFCAQTAGSMEDAKRLLIRLFETFYDKLPAAVQENLAYLIEEVGYEPTKLKRLKRICGDVVPTVVIALASLRRNIHALLAQSRDRYVERIAFASRSSMEPLPPGIPDSMRMQEGEEFILDISREGEFSRCSRAA
jgi:hypothetical protein